MVLPPSNAGLLGRSVRPSRRAARFSPWRRLGCVLALGVLALGACKGDVFEPAADGGAGGVGGDPAAGRGGGSAGDTVSSAGASSGGAAGAIDPGGAAGSKAPGGSGGLTGTGGASGSAVGGSAGKGAAGAAGKGGGGASGASGGGASGAGGKADAPRIHQTACDGKTADGLNACGQKCQCQGGKWKCAGQRGEICQEVGGAVCDSVNGTCICRNGRTYCPPSGGEQPCATLCTAAPDLYYACKTTTGDITTCTCAYDWVCAP